MDNSCEAKILILVDPAVAERWSQILQGPGTLVWLGPEAVPVGQQPDVLVTTAPQAGLERWPGCGVVGVGIDGPCDVQLLTTCTERELQLACRLLAQIVRLRRQQQLSFETQQRLSMEALTDPLTGLSNRRAWDAVLVERLASATPSRRLCLAILDLDHFKHVNDVHGHAVGDHVLRTAGRAIAEGLRQGDFVARIGGDEFGLLLWVPNESVAAAVVQRVRTHAVVELSQSPATRVTASAGWGLGPCEPKAMQHTELFAAADAALCQAKRDGRDRTVGAGY